MDYKETLDYLFSSAPMFQQVGSKAYKEGLENTLALDKHFEHPHREFRSIHVGGTNGKGSCSCTLAAILQSAGYKVGLYTSPHLLDFRERIRINGEMIPEAKVIRFVEEHRSFFEPLYPSFFELTTALAFRYFADEKIDVAIIEVGMGGRLDCTNIIHPDLSIITNIGLDHMQFLGDTLEKIAAEKAGIIKEGVPVVIGNTTEETKAVFMAKAETVGAPLILADEDMKILNAILKSIINLKQLNKRLYAVLEEINSCMTTAKQCMSPEIMDLDMAQKMIDEANAQEKLYTKENKASLMQNVTGFVYETEEYPNLEGELGGICQKENSNTILHALSQLKLLGYRIEEESVRKGFAHVCELTGLMGRFQKINERPLVICDTGHNVDGIMNVVQHFTLLDYKHLHIVIGVVNDKDIDGILELLPQKATYYFTRASVQRALPAKELRDKARNFGLRGNCYPTVKSAVQAAKNKCLPEDFLFVGGSSFIVADLLSCGDAFNFH